MGENDAEMIEIHFKSSKNHDGRKISVESIASTPSPRGCY